MAAASLTPALLRCEFHVDPLAVDDPKPRLSWECRGEGRDLRQRAYQVVVARDAAFRDLLWDSGKVESSAQAHIRYAGAALASFARAHWRVRVWDQDDRVSPWSDTARWAVGVLERAAWTAQWAVPTSGFQCYMAPRFRRRFQAKGDVVDARLYATARGIFTAAVNGHEVSDEQFAPGWTDYHQRIHYRCYDVTKLVQRGDNVVGATVAGGWFNGAIGWNGTVKMYGDRQQLLAMLRLEYADGRVETIGTDGEWRIAHGPVHQASLLMGEHFDATCDDPAWATPQGSDVGWSPVHLQPVGDKPLLVAHPGEPVRRTEIVPAVAVTPRRAGVWLVDFGQNLAGRVRLTMRVAPGTTVRLRHAEILNPQGDVYIDNLRSAASTDVYVAKGGGETYEPTFTFHGFRYAEVSGLPTAPKLEDVQAVVIGTDTRRVGTLETSDKLIDRIYQNTLWTQRANFIEIPTDCPQRDERMGWTGDAQAFIRTATCSMDVASFFTKWLVDLTDAQYADGAFTNVAPNVPGALGGWQKADAAWGDAGTICPWTCWQVYGDRDLLARQYPSMVRWCDYLKSESRHWLRRHDERRHVCFGDWLSVDAHTSRDIIMTAFFAHSTRITADAADVLGKGDDAKRLREQHANIARAFRRAFIRADGAVLADDQAEVSQTAQILALHFDLCDDAQRPAVLAKLIEDLAKRSGRLSTGFVGLPYLLPVLSRHGRTDLCIKLLQNEEYPGWGYSIRNGATTIWERWNGWTKEKGPGDPGMNSYSHYAYGSCCEWLFTDLAGIDLAEPGFASVRIRPRVGHGVTRAKATYHGMRGVVESAWSLADGKVQLDVVVPPNTSAEVLVPCRDLATLREGGATVAGAELADGYARVRVGSGRYRFTAAVAGEAARAAAG